MIRVLMALLATAAGAPALAGAPLYQPPQGCALDMTVQLRGCQVANHFRCSGDPAGDRWASYADGEGEYFLSRIDDETRWLESISPREGIIDRLDAAASADPASFSTLLATGRDDFDFITHSTMGETRRYIGHDETTGEMVTIGGVTLERTRFELRIEDGNGGYIATRKGSQFISRDQRLFFSDAEIFENAFGEKVTTNEPPATFAFPGDKGFGAAKPEYDCDMMMTDMSPVRIHPTL